MTDGSSQGLLVVVAVVIFGIFVAISYSLFRDQLTPSLASIFKDSLSLKKDVQQNQYDIHDFEYVKNVGINSKNIFTIAGNKAIINEESLDSGVSLTLSANNKTHTYGIGIKKNENIFENTFYKVSFTVEMLEGDANKIGGHIIGFAKVYSIFIDNVKHRGSWHEPTTKELKEGETYLVEFIMKTYDVFTVHDSLSPKPKFFIQLDRGIEGTKFKYNLNNIKVEEVKPKTISGGL